MTRPPALLIAAWGALAGPAAAEECRLALVLALDVSISVDAEEERLLRDGLARALVAPDVVRVILAGDPAALHAFQWSGQRSQWALWEGWATIREEADLRHLAELVRSAERPERPDDFTAVGAALRHAAGMLAQAPDCRRKVIDVSGDGENNDGPPPARVRGEGSLDGVTVNGLVIGGGWDEARAAEWYRTEVLHGPDAFLIVAAGYGDFERAMTAKLVREIEARVVSKEARP